MSEGLPFELVAFLAGLMIGLAVSGTILYLSSKD